MITKEEFEKAVNYCTGITVNCKDCPLGKKKLICGAYFAEYIKKTSLHLRQQVQAQRKKKTLFKLMIAQKQRFVKHTKLLMKLAQIYLLFMRECQNVSREPLISERHTEKYSTQDVSLKN